MSVNENNPDRGEFDDEILIGRLIDGEASDADERRFEASADVRPELWRTLALRQRDMMTLSTEVERETAGVERVELHGISILPRRLTWPLAVSGWAAVLIVGMTWAAVVLFHDLNEGAEPVGDLQPPSQRLTWMDHGAALDWYMTEAPWHVRDMAPVLQQIITLEDGSLLIRSMRRFDEELIIPPDIAAKLRKAQDRGEEIPVDMFELAQYLRERFGWAPEQADDGSS